jgi:RNA polymerase sigma-70 factor (ECF subfamily)
MDDPEVKWLQGARRLDEGALEAIYDAFSDELYRYAYRLLGSVISAEDLVAETFYRFLRALHAGGGPRLHLRAYLYRVAHNTAVDQRRHRRDDEIQLNPQAPLESHQPGPETQTEVAVECERVREALWNLTDDQRQVILLKYFQGMSNQEVGGVLNKSLGAVKSLQHRGLRALAKILAPEEESREVGG